MLHAGGDVDPDPDPNPPPGGPSTYRSATPFCTATAQATASTRWQQGVVGRGSWPLTMPAYEESRRTIVWRLPLSIHSVEWLFGSLAGDRRRVRDVRLASVS